MTPRNVVIAFAASVIAVVAGWFAGVAARDVWGDQYETAIGVVDTQAGIPVGSATPTPTPLTTPTPSPTQSPSPSPSASPSPSPTPLLTDAPGFCDGPPPAPGCDCDLQDGDWVWQCPLDPTPDAEND
jgi:hypothetical protein